MELVVLVLDLPKTLNSLEDTCSIDTRQVLRLVFQRI